MNLVTLDFETYFDGDYTLKKMTTEEYIRDPRFKVHCMGAQIAGEACAVDTSPFINHALHVAACGAEYGFLCHHAQFDGLILSHHYGIRPPFWFDTLSMARLVFPHAKSHSLGALAKLLGLQEKTVPYESFKGVRDLPPDLYNRVAQGCANDVELTHAIFQKLLPYVPAEELRIIDLTIRMFTEATLDLDRPRMQSYLDATKRAKEELLSQLGISKAELQSSEKFAGLLRQLGVSPPTKPSPKHPEKMIYAFSKTDEAMKDLLEDQDERVSTLCAARLGQKSTIGETRAQRLLDMQSRGPLPVYLNYCGAHTTRWSGGDSVNWQNLFGELKASVMAPSGYLLGTADLSQIECRLLNWLADQTDVLEAFEQGRDLYSEGATRFYGRTITKADKVERHLGKTLELGCGYGMGWEKFQTTCKRGALGGPPILLSDDDAKRAVGSYRASHKAVTRLWRYADQVLQALHCGTNVFDWGPMRVRGKFIMLPNGAQLDYSNLRYIDNEYCTVTRKGVRKIYGAKLVENVVQALARVVLSQAMLKIALKYRIVLCTHDDVLFLTKKEEAPAALAEVMQIMKTPPAWCQGIPLDVEGGYSERYSK